MERGSEKERRNKICDKDGEAGGRGLGDVDQVRREKARVIRPTPINICIGNRKVIRSCAVADVFGAFVGGKKFRISLGVARVRSVRSSVAFQLYLRCF